jgi:hypothetical protein
VHCRIYGSYTTNPVLLQINPIHIVKIQLYKIHINFIRVLLSTHVSESRLFLPGFPTTILCGFLFSPMLSQSHSLGSLSLNNFSQRTMHKKFATTL